MDVCSVELSEPSYCDQRIRGTARCRGEAMTKRESTSSRNKVMQDAAEDAKEKEEDGVGEKKKENEKRIYSYSPRPAHHRLLGIRAV